jgi:hypothetical protein
MKKSLLGLLILCFTIGIATFAAAQDSATKKDDKSGGVTARGQAGDTKFDIQVQKDQGERGPAGDRGPQGVPGPQGAPGPAGSTTVLGMDPTIALLVGLGVLAVVIVAIVAASRGRET